MHPEGRANAIESRQSQRVKSGNPGKGQNKQWLTFRDRTVPC